LSEQKGAQKKDGESGKLFHKIMDLKKSESKGFR